MLFNVAEAQAASVSIVATVAAPSSCVQCVQPAFSPKAADVLKALQQPPSDVDECRPREVFDRRQVSQTKCRQPDHPQFDDFFRDLDAAQKQAVRPIVDFVDGIRNDSRGSPPRLLFHGGPGSGKTHAIRRLIEYAESKRVRVACAASFAAAAVNMMNGETLHSLFGIGVGAVLKLLQLSPGRLQELIDRFKNVDLLIIDEISCVAPQLLAQVSQRARQIWKNTQDFGGCAVVLVGDMFQIPPVGSNSLAMGTVQLQLQHKYPPGHMIWEGCRLFQTFSLISFDGQQRAKNDLDWCAAISAARKTGSIPESMVNLATAINFKRYCERSTVAISHDHHKDCSGGCVSVLRPSNTMGEAAWSTCTCVAAQDCCLVAAN